MAFTGLKAAGGAWGGQTPSGTIGDQRFGQNEPFEPEKNSGLRWPSPASRPLEGPGGGQTPSGTIRDQCFGQNEPFEPEKNSGLGWPSPASRPLEGPGGARHHQGPSGINAEVKRNQLSQKKISASVGLGWPRVASGGLGQPQGPRWGRMLSGTIRDRR